MSSETTIQPSVASPSAVFQCSTVSQQVSDQFTEMKTILSSFIRPRQETTRTAFCNFLASEVEALEKRDFQTFRNKAVKLWVRVRAGQRKGPVSPSNLHFLGAPVPLPHMCHRLFNSQTNQHQLPGNTSWLFKDSDASKPGHPTSSAERGGTHRTAATHRAADFLRCCWRPTTQAFKTAYFHTNPNEAL